MQADTGADIPEIGVKIWHRIGEPILQKLGASVLGADGSKMEVFGCFDADKPTKAKVIILSRVGSRERARNTSL